MRNLYLILFFVGHLLHSQTSSAHVVYFETGKYNVPDIESNRLVLFVQSLKRHSNRAYFYLWFYR